VMQEVKASGKARHIGISSSVPFIDDYVKWGVFEAYQIAYSALQREQETAITVAAKSGAGVIVRGGVARGAPEERGLGGKDRWAVWEKARLDDLRSPGESRTAFLLRFTISHPDMHTTIVGTMIPEHLADNVKAAQAGPLPAGVYEEAKARL